MLILALIWSFFGAVAIAIGVEAEATWKKVFKLGAVVDSVRRFLLIGGLIASLATIGCSFYFFVMSNAIIVLIAWIAAFLIARFAVEIMRRRNVYAGTEHAPPPVRSDVTRQAAYAGRREETSDVEEVDSSEPLSPSEARELSPMNAGAAAMSEREAPIRSEAIERPIPSAGGNEAPAPQSPMAPDPDDPSSGAYAEIFKRLNSK
ncbi:MAG TPA: hypothetical protein VHF05_01935 [Candidatus Paceibacterota bacterium]|jgi:hypothetical protein|nr:hypothetical protein [Candidatus Paceibacterota bacterium]